MTGLRYVTLAAAATLTLGCAVERIKYVGRLGGSEGSGGGTQPVTGGSAGAETGGEGGAAASSTGGSVVPAGTRCYGEPPEQSGGADGACAGVEYEVEARPVDLYLLMDRSDSMLQPLGDGTLTRWETISNAIRELVAMDEAQRVEVGLQFFSLSGADRDSIDCDPASYAEAAVAIAPLSETGPLIAQAIDDMQARLGGLTPTYAALQGGLDHAIEHSATIGEHGIGVVLITDGMPTQCEEQAIESIAELAERAHLDAGVFTFVIGLDIGYFNLLQIAQAGGTFEPYIIDGGDGVEQFVSTIRNLSRTELPCEFDIPEVVDPNLEVDYDQVQVLYEPITNEPPEEVPRVAGPDVCPYSPHGGWYYDSSADPQQIRLCACSCNRFGAGRATVRFGCRPRVFDLP